MKKVIFISSRPLGRCENITAVYNALNDNYVDKVFDRMWDRTSDILHDPNAQYDLVVTDELVKESNAPVVMIFHGAAMGKTYLLQRDNNPETEVLKKASKLLKYAVTSTTNGIPTTAMQCGIAETKVIPLGMPRMDAYFYEKDKVNTVLSMYERSYLYAPTFRSIWDADIPDIDLDKIDSLLTDREIFAIKPHMINKGFRLKDGYKHIIQISKDEPSKDYILDCDVLVTDYSSILYDAHVAGKPVVLFEKDHESYLEDPGMCLPYPEGYASRHCRDEETLVELMRNAYSPMDADLACYEMTCNMCDGHATERVIKLINDILEGRR